MEPPTSPISPSAFPEHPRAWHARGCSGNAEGEIGEVGGSIVKVHLSGQIGENSFGVGRIFFSAGSRAQFVDTLLSGRFGKSSLRDSKAAAQLYLFDELLRAR